MPRKRSTNVSKRWGRPTRRQTRYLTCVETKRGFLYYWTPPSKLRKLDGRPDWLNSTPLGDNLSDAITEADKLNAKLDAWRGNNRVKDGMSAMVEAYLVSPRFLKLADRTRADYRPHLDVIRQDFRGSDPGDITPVNITKYQDALARMGLSPRQATYRMQVLRLLFAWGHSRGHAPTNPAARLELSTKARQAPRIWTPDAINEMMDKPYPVGLAAILALFTLQRQGDILAMQWHDIANGAIRVVQSKTGKALALPIHPHLQAALDLTPRLGDTILATRGRPYSQDGFRTLWHRAAPKGSPTFHQVRSTATTWLRAGGMADEDVMLWTGHGRQGDGAILDVYDRRLGDLRAKAWPIMDGWRAPPQQRKDA